MGPSLYICNPIRSKQVLGVALADTKGVARLAEAVEGVVERARGALMGVISDGKLAKLMVQLQGEGNAIRLQGFLLMYLYESDCIGLRTSVWVAAWAILQ